MLVGCCIKCKHLELVESGGESTCPQCGGKIVSLGVDANKWNNMSNDEMLSLIESTIKEAKTPIKPALVQPVFGKSEGTAEDTDLSEHSLLDNESNYDRWGMTDINNDEAESKESTSYGTRGVTGGRAKRVGTADPRRTSTRVQKSDRVRERSRLPLIIGIIVAAVIGLGVLGFFLYSKLGYIEVTLPKQFVENTSAEDLTASLPDDIKVIKNDDGSATYKIPKYKHKKLMEELRSSMEEGMTRFTTGSDAVFTSVTHNDDYTEFKVTCKGNQLSLFDSLYTLVFYYYGGFYNIFNGTPTDNVKVVFLDQQGNVIEEANSKNMGDGGNSVPVDNTTSQTDNTSQVAVEGAENLRNEAPAQAESAELTIEQVDAKCVAFKTVLGTPSVSAYVAFKNTSDVPITLRDVSIDYEDDNGKLISTDTMPNCIPEAIKPGQVGYLYSYYHDISQVDLSNGLSFKPNANIVAANDFYEIEVSDVSAKTSDFLDVSVIGRGTNNTGEEKSLVEPGAVFFDKDNNVIGFCYGLETFPAGQTKSFEISGDLLSDDYDKSALDHVEVYIQGCSLW